MRETSALEKGNEWETSTPGKEKDMAGRLQRQDEKKTWETSTLGKEKAIGDFNARKS